jgi:hypothetical protein
MHPKLIKLLALSVICGSSLIGFALSGGAKENIMFFVSVVAVIWFIIYWLMCGVPDR